MSEMPWVRFFPSDWLAGTRGLSAVETGIYITLIATMYERGEPVPEDAPRLARRCGASVAAFKTALENLVEEGKIARVDGGLWNERVGKESVYRAEKSEVGRQAATARWQKKNNENNAGDDADAMQSQSDGNASQKPEARSQKAAAQLGADAFLYDRLIEAASARGPCHQSLAMGIGPMTDLMAKGYDLDRDILPIIREKANPTVRSWKFFVTIIVQRAAEREAIPAKPAREETDWAGWCQAFFADGTWKHSLGPTPAEHGCRAPPEIIAQSRPHPHEQTDRQVA